MKALWQKISHHQILVFCCKTAFYVAILFFLLYLYDYSHVGSGGFIYNEF
ncbi:teichoic acid D-Ala incorporation-associated protein DltX [Isobaculum melis]|nr:teichoic acid D-Ala incorporation-associated protein DltX [Isobaculum melis]